MQIASAAGALKVDERENLSLVMSSKYHFENEKLMDHDSVAILPSKNSEVVDFNSKPRTALFQGRENDEPMAPQDTSTENSPISNMVIGLQFRAIYFDKKYGKNMDKFTSTGLSSNIYFRSVLLLDKKKKRAAKEICQYGDHARQDKGPPNLNT